MARLYKRKTNYLNYLNKEYNTINTKYYWITLQIYDGVIPVASAKLSLDEMKVLSKSRKDLPSTIYTTGHTAIIRIHLGKLIAASKTSQFLNSAPFQLKITKVKFGYILSKNNLTVWL